MPSPSSILALVASSALLAAAQQASGDSREWSILQFNEYNTNIAYTHQIQHTYPPPASQPSAPPSSRLSTQIRTSPPAPRGYCPPPSYSTHPAQAPLSPRPRSSPLSRRSAPPRPPAANPSSPATSPGSVATALPNSLQTSLSSDQTTTFSTFCILLLMLSVRKIRMPFVLFELMMKRR